jgi:hypothetical protein
MVSGYTTSVKRSMDTACGIAGVNPAFFNVPHETADIPPAVDAAGRPTCVNHAPAVLAHEAP